MRRFAKLEIRSIEAADRYNDDRSALKEKTRQML
jgi:hypothetical protein